MFQEPPDYSLVNFHLLCSTVCFSPFFVRRVQRCDRNCPSTPRSQISVGTRTNGPWCEIQTECSRPFHGREGISELDLVAAAESVSRSEGFGGQVQMRRFPLECNRGVIVSGRAGGVPSFFDSAIGGAGPHPLLEWVQDSTKSNRMNPFSLISFTFIAVMLSI